MSGALAERDFATKLERAGFTVVEVVHREPFGVDDAALYPLFTADVIQLMRDLIPADKQDAVAMSIVIKARLPGRRRGGASLAPKEETRMTDAQKTEEEWEQVLPRERYEVLRHAGTEPPFSGDFLYNKETGMYRCGACGADLFRSDAKFDSGTGWPSFFEPADEENLETRTDSSHGQVRTEVLCRRCGSHLGHLFPDGPNPTGLRYCINSLALDFQPEEAKD